MQRLYSKKRKLTKFETICPHSGEVPLYVHNIGMNNFGCAGCTNEERELNELKNKPASHPVYCLTVRLVVFRSNHACQFLVDNFDCM